MFDTHRMYVDLRLMHQIRQEQNGRNNLYTDSEEELADMAQKKKEIHRFSPKLQYSIVLDQMREIFIEKWNKSMQPSPQIGMNDFHILANLGKGSYGRVLLGRSKFDNTDYCAIKVLMKDNLVSFKHVRNVFNEKKVLSCVSFPFLMNLKFSTKCNDFVCLGMPYLSGGDLFKYHRHVRGFNEKQARFYAAQVLLGLEYLHNVNILYRDLKLENIIIDECGFIKITDFSFAKLVNRRTTTLCGTPEYLAPEILRSVPYGKCVDWWTFGILLFELVHGESPFAKYKDVMVMFSKILALEYDMPKNFSDVFKNLIHGLLEDNVTKRLGNLADGADDVKKHIWFATVKWFAVLNREVNPPYIPILKNVEDSTSFRKHVQVGPFLKSNTNRYGSIFEHF